MREVNIRQIEENDFSFMHETLFSTWYKTENQTSTIPYAVAEIDLNHSLNQSTFGLIAEIDGENMGFILARVDNERLQMRQFQSDPYQALIKILSIQPNNFSEHFSFLMHEQAINTAMLSRSDRQFEAEICLLIVLPAARGYGIGSKLYQKTIEYFKKHDVSNYYLFTDDACDYQFYESREMIRSQTQPLKPKETEDNTFNYYLYENNY